MRASKKEKENKVTEEKFTKGQIVNSKTFVDNKDLLNAVLNENKSYSKQEVNKIVENYRKGKVS